MAKDKKKWFLLSAKRGWRSKYVIDEFDNVRDLKIKIEEYYSEDRIMKVISGEEIKLDITISIALAI